MAPVEKRERDNGSGTPLPRKLGIKAARRVAFVKAPPEFADALGELPEGVVDVKVSAIDATWSGLKLVIRVKDRPPR